MKKISQLFILLLFFSTGRGQNAPSKEETEIKKVLETFMNLIRTKGDSSLFYRLFNSEPVTWVGIFTEKTQRKRLEKDPGKKDYFSSNYKSFYRSILADKPAEEKFSQILIHQDGAIATVIFDYSFWLEGKMTNWGKESWGLVKTGGDWKISSIIFSIEF